MSTRESIWRQRAGLLVVAGIFFAANLAFLLGSRSITAARRQALEERQTTLSRDVASREAEAAKLGGQRDRLAQVSSVIDEFYGRRVGSRRETLAPIVEEVHAVMQKVGVSTTAISYSTTPLKTLPLWQMLIGFHFDSDYARFKRLLLLKESENIGKAINDAMAAIEEENSQLGGVLPRTYQEFSNSTLVSLLRSVNAILGNMKGTPSARCTSTSSASSPSPRAPREASISRRPQSCD